MGGTTVLPPSLPPRRSAAAADLHSCSSRVRVNPALMANPAAAKRPKRPMSVRDGSQPQPPAKRVRGVCPGGELRVAVAAEINLPCPTSGKGPKSPKNQVAESPASATQPKPPINMRELIENARLAKAWARPAAAEEEASCRRDIERSRAEARRKVERMVDTVQFNDPYIDPSDVTKSPHELLEARQEAWRAQAQLIAMARRRDMETYK
ncbi:hypothetical protein CFC21_099274 [Triticum aestivum]|uniref:Calmodulin-binding domain-containing protein n=2 Tax=Triticum aestivum TaxID=4565 RepID=A0A9R1LYM6_WHEAT|nr:uncharacterized protein LOC123148633 [Triticum aestivum]KAF7097459.1 hypothetical protein CFC21_099274 [Triticum aestivum]